jgi:hypothetical protein
MLTAAAHADAAGPAQHNAVVGQVLAEALDVGAHGPDVASLLSEAGGHGQSGDNGLGTGLGFLHQAAHIDPSEALMPIHFAFLGETMVHQDAPPPAG